ncbi:uncharacterized protein F5147DRAFT_792789 [Suillus discolor]|uniref:ABM domain-containing protein n=1 Tax=Suillus discolor TaxID=1912936 RepID=A0A9P7JLP5_9AGAM|nr:uncharacterized protein F5147DRAFT_792789 [Suillus discolor]KAG2085708.1 hypothetical protein F5147DRAFT_792789 [Suillus discolor]
MSNTPVTEIITLTSNDAMKTTPKFQEAVELLCQSTFEGLQQMYWGDRIQQPGIRQWFINWDHHPQRSESTAAIAAQIKEKLGAVVDSPPMCRLVVFNPYPPTKCFVTPFTEVIISTVKPETDLNEFSKIIDASLEVCHDFEGCYGTAWGYVVNAKDAKEVVLLLGWESPEHHVAFMQTEPARRTTPPYVEGVEDSTVFYIQSQDA